MRLVHEFTLFANLTDKCVGTTLINALGRRILKDSNGVTRKYVYDNEDILLEFNNADQLQAKFTHGAGIDEPIEMNRNNDVYFYQGDGLGSVVALSNGLGDIVQSYAYSAFGETRVYNQMGVESLPVQVIQSPYGYTGREWDYETGLNYHRARYYDPYTGRWISEDSAGQEEGGINLYKYALSNPVLNVDSTGQFPSNLDEAGECIWGNNTNQIDNFNRNIKRNEEEILNLQWEINNPKSCEDSTEKK